MPASVRALRVGYRIVTRPMVSAHVSLNKSISRFASGICRFEYVANAYVLRITSRALAAASIMWRVSQLWFWAGFVVRYKMGEDLALAEHCDTVSADGSNVILCSDT